VLVHFNGSDLRKNNVQAFAWPHESFVSLPAPRSSFTFVK